MEHVEVSANVHETAPTDWKYINEGGATIVFAYIGIGHPIFSGTVLRLRKVANGQPGLGSPDEPEDPTVAFQSKVIASLIPAASLPVLETVSLRPTWLESLATVVEQARPIARRNRDAIDTTRFKGVLATNLTPPAGISFEIKPKWGFLPNPKHLSASSCMIKSRFCRYCMHSSLRSTSSEYCPLDLFSPHESRTRKAVASLFKMWSDSDAGTNNLRVFINGSRVHPTAESIDIITEGLGLRTSRDPSEAIIATLTNALRDNPLLQTLQSLQRRLDALDIEGLLKLATVHNQTGIPEVKSFASLDYSEPTLEQWVDFIERFTTSDPAPADSLSLRDLRFDIMAYLLSATFKDCSIIARFQPGRSDVQSFVIDLEPKSISRLDKWFELDQEIAQAFQVRMQNEPDTLVCIDDNF